MSTAVMMVALLFLTTTIAPSQAQDTASCAQNLISCAEYLNTTTTPPDSCCSSIKDAVTNDLTCLCNLYNTPGLLESFKVNVTQALALTGRCGVNSDLSACSKAGADAPTTPPPPGVPGNDGSRMAWTGFSSLLLMCATSLFY
ncbi:non-specific lipid transfer protein GPI-anchored 7 [Ricinus communis]|uniref:Lipid binding protein, putative n=1 Tax=Ricinus communis TaxID=3988 RepID=B9RBQ4_RICCO|nr:non-specific lipid transfer protein GPI-anchored 7 [Ricinus communis]EEF50975.1 lipid binding protein, putative [Ricinus communis]|eukprot:XP_002509588.1 lipid transfer-like protein VAS [Ricinus communis]